MKSIHVRKTIKRVGALMAGVALMLSTPMISHAEGKYTYCYDYWGDVQQSPDAYEVAGVFTAVDLGLDKAFNTPSGLTVVGRNVYVCDTGNSRILQFELTEDKQLELKETYTEVKGNTEVKNLNKPNDFQIGEDGCIYIADTGNARIVKLDSEWNYMMEFIKPVENTLAQDLVFQPKKIAIDGAGRVYCVAAGINKGLVKFEADGNFSGFVGATPVVYNVLDYLQKRFATQAQREKLAKFVPTEYDDIYRDHDGFIYACCSNLKEEDLKSGAAQAVRKLNLQGNNILKTNGNFPVYGDIYMGSGGGHEGSSQIVDVTAFDNDVYVILDKNRGRLFTYDDQGRLLYAFGGNGNMDGYFRQPIAIDHMGYDLIVLDTLDKTLTLFTPTAYGNLIFEAIDSFNAGEYDRSGDLWNEVLEYNGNYDLAYIGVGRSYLRKEDYKKALEYFELKYDDDNYSKAFKQYRKEWVEEHILAIFIIVFGLFLIPMGIGKIMKIKHEIDSADIFRF